MKSFIRPPALRVRVDEVPLEFTDEHYGYHRYVLEEDCGDFIVRRSDGVLSQRSNVMAQPWHAVETGGLECAQGRWNSSCSGEMLRYDEEPRLRRQPSGA